MLKNLSKVFKQPRLQERFCQTSTEVKSKVKVYDALQKQALKEQCILVSENDEPIGFTTKEDCHRVNHKQQVKMHRAFSVFLFNSKGEMLMQRRSKYKITFPDMYTNACCSHPLYDIEEERIMPQALGVRKAAQRRLNQELGVPTEQIQPNNFRYLTRIRYSNIGDGIWGENEIDYILILQKDLDLNPNINEVSEVRYMKRENFVEEVNKLKAPITPWFQLMFKHRLLTLWWDNLHQLEQFEEHNKIQQLV